MGEKYLRYYLCDLFRKMGVLTAVLVGVAFLGGFLLGVANPIWTMEPKR